MKASIESLGIDRLSIEERLVLVEKIWDSIAADSAAMPLTEAQRVELQKRIEEDDANPDDVIPWEQIRASALPTPGRGHDDDARLEVLILIGLQASGKSTFCRKYFCSTHIVISKDYFRSSRRPRRREMALRGYAKDVL